MWAMMCFSWRVSFDRISSTMVSVKSGLGIICVDIPQSRLHFRLKVDLHLSQWLNVRWIIVPGRIHLFGYRLSDQFCYYPIVDDILQLSKVVAFGIEPSVVFTRLQYHRHSVVDVPYGLTCRGCYNRTRFVDRSVRPLWGPLFPKPCKGKWLFGW